MSYVVISPPEAAKRKNLEFPWLGNWLADAVVSSLMLETGWLAQGVRFPTLEILL